MNQKEREMFLSQFPLSKDTDNLRDACRKLMNDRDGVTAKIGQLMDNDTGDAEAVARKITDMQNQRTLIENRLGKKREEARQSALVDLRAHEKVFHKALRDCRGRLSRGREAWQESATTLFGAARAKSVVGDSSLEPPTIASLRSDLADATNRYKRLTDFLCWTDPLRPRAAAFPTDGSPEHPTDAWFYNNLAKLIVELVG